MKKLKTNYTLLFISIITFLSFHTILNAEVKLPQIFSSNMVLQRNAEITVWGWASNRESVKVSFNNHTLNSRASRDGKWSVVFPAMKEGGPYEMLIEGKNNTIRLENILIGDVWICSGQSNMEWSVSRSDNPEEEIKNSDYPDIRLFTVRRTVSLSPANDVPDAEWNICSPSAIPNFSAVAYFFGRKVHTETGIPIGLIHTSWGGTNVEAWTSRDFMEKFPEFTDRLKLLGPSTQRDISNAEALRIRMLEEEYNIKKGVLPRENWADPNTDLSRWKTMRIPSTWESRGLSGVDGVVWFRRDIELSEEHSTGRLILNLGKIDDSDSTWVNGILVGSTLNHNSKDRSYTVDPGIFRPGRNVVTVKVIDTGGDGGFRGAPSDMKLQGTNFSVPLDGNWRYRLSGEELVYNHDAMGPNEIPSQLFNGMIHPLLNLKVAGAIWYQGESNAGRAYRYRELFPNMIHCWRAYWNQPDMPFLFVQLANFRPANDEPVDSEWAELREAQLMTLSLPNTGMAVAIDIGDPDDIHPGNKQDVGKRLALNALKIVYNKDIVSMGPMYKSMEINNKKITLTFDHEGSGLMAMDKYGYLKGFAIAGPDRKFHWAKAYIEDNRVIVYSPSVPSPVAVRYGWSENPEDVNLYNKEGLPASPFRTDNWDGITKGKL